MTAPDRPTPTPPNGSDGKTRAPECRESYLPPNQLEMPDFALDAPSSTFLSNWSTFFSALAFASLAYASASALALAISLCVLATCRREEVSQ